MSCPVVNLCVFPHAFHLLLSWNHFISKKDSMAIKQQWTILLALAASSASAVDAPIQSVTLYPGSASVERVVQVAPGMTQVEITGLLANFNTDTVRLQADPGIQVGQVVTRDQRGVDSPSPREAELEAKVQALQDQVAAIDAEIKSAQLVQGYLERLGGGEQGAGAPRDANALLGTLEAIRKGGSDALARMHNAEVRKRSLTKQLDVLKRDLAKVQASTRESRSMTVAVAVRQPGKILLTYQVNRAGWKPVYRASLDANASTVELERMAAISQKTGEDWSRVKLRLSTGQPNLSAQAPDPLPWLLTWQPPQVLQEMQATMQYR
ncbi:MAG: mucoidy inhibitor MuiA family protein, partial [Massilia sp.]